jgi:hypothetical protein
VENSKIFFLYESGAHMDLLGEKKPEVKISGYCPLNLKKTLKNRSALNGAVNCRCPLFTLA